MAEGRDGKGVPGTIDRKDGTGRARLQPCHQTLIESGLQPLRSAFQSLLAQSESEPQRLKPSHSWRTAEAVPFPDRATAPTPPRF